MNTQASQNIKVTKYNKTLVLEQTLGDVKHTINFVPEYYALGGYLIKEHLTYYTTHNSKFGYDGDIKYHHISQAPLDMLQKLQDERK